MHGAGVGGGVRCATYPAPQNFLGEKDGLARVSCRQSGCREQEGAGVESSLHLSETGLRGVKTSAREGREGRRRTRGR